MKKLPAWIEREIKKNAIFGFDLKEPNAENVDWWLENIENNLSPENLCCDGELSRSAVQVKSRELNAAMRYCQQIKSQK